MNDLSTEIVVAMRLVRQVLWTGLISSLLCIVYPLSVDKKSGLSIASEPYKAVRIEEADEYEEGSGDEAETEPPIEFDDFVDLDALARGITGPENKQDSVVPCFGTWWPSNGGYVYYYDDYGSDYGDGGGTDDGGGDYGRRRRNRRRRRRRMRNRSRRRSRTTAKRTSKKKS